MNNKILIVVSPYYKDIASALLCDAIDTIKSNNYAYEILYVPGALEIPAAIAINAEKYLGYVALGCVIKGETYHFNVVADQSSRGLMELAIHYKLAIGNGILTVDTMEQAIIRAKDYNTGKNATQATIELIKVKMNA